MNSCPDDDIQSYTGTQVQHSLPRVNGISGLFYIYWIYFVFIQSLGGNGEMVKLVEYLPNLEKIGWACELYCAVLYCTILIVRGEQRWVLSGLSVPGDTLRRLSCPHQLYPVKVSEKLRINNIQRMCYMCYNYILIKFLYLIFAQTNKLTHRH